MRHRRILTVASAALLGPATLLAAPPPAFAGLPILAQAQIDITFTATTFTVCASGHLVDGSGMDGTWLYEIDGARSDGSLIHNTLGASGESFGPACIQIPKNGTSNGAFTASVSFVTIGTNDFGATSVGEGSWNPNNANSIST